MKIDLENGSIILINKPIEWTSFDAVNKIKHEVLKRMRLTSTRFPPPAEDKLPVIQAKAKIKIGHAGTLDPLATGLLIICIGKETKNIEQYVGLEKEYTGTFFMGATRPSFDRETEIDQTYDIAHLNPDIIKNSAAKFIGEQMQVPPIFSAIKKDGKRAYKSARAGDEIIMNARQVLIKEFEITGIELPVVHFRIVCSKGTYIRSMANDFGKALNSGAYLDSLCRTRIGQFKLVDAMSMEELIASFTI